MDDIPPTKTISEIPLVTRAPSSQKRRDRKRRQDEPEPQQSTESDEETGDQAATDQSDRQDEPLDRRGKNIDIQA